MANVVRILITTDNTQAKKGLAEVKAEGMSLGSVMKLAGAGIALSLGAATVASLKMASEFQANMERIHTQAGVAQDQIKGLGDGVLKLAGQVGQDPNSLAEALYHIESSFASTGITSQHALGLLKIAAEGATVGGANLVDVTNALDAAVVSGIPGVQNLSQAMGTLNATVGAGDMNMQDLASAFSTGLLASVKGFGLSITDVGSALAVFGDNNIRGQNAATQLRMAVTALAQPAKGGAEALRSLGLQQDTLAKDMQSGGLNKALTDLVQRMQVAGISADQQGQIITEAFGKKAGIGINLLVGQYDRLQSKYTDLAKGANTFQDAWTATTHTFQFQVSAFIDSAKAAGISLGTALLPAVSDVIGALRLGLPIISGVAQVFTAIPGPLRNAALAFGAFALVGKLLGPVLEKVGLQFAVARWQVRQWVTGIAEAEGVSGKFTAATSGMTGAVSKVGLAFGAVMAITQAFGSSDAGVKGVDTTTKALLQLAGTGNDTSGTLKDLNHDLSVLAEPRWAQSIESSLSSLTNNFADTFNQSKDRIAAVDGALSGLVSSGHADQAARVFQALADRAKAQGMSLADLKNLLPQYQNALDATTTSEHLQVQAGDSLATVNDKLSQSLGDLTSALSAANNAVLGLMGSEDAYYGAIQSATDAVKQNGKATEVTTAAGRANRQALEALAKAGLDYLAGLQQQGDGQDVIHSKLLAVEAQFYRTARSMGYTDAQAKELRDSIFGDAAAADAGAVSAQNMAAALRGIPAQKRVTVTVTAVGNGVNLLQSSNSNVVTYVNPGGSRVRAQRTGGISAAAGGGPRGNWTLVGEEGPELAELPPGTMVRSHPDTQAALARGGFGGGAPVVNLNVYAPIGSQRELERWLLEAGRMLVRTVGHGSTEATFGTA